MPCPTCKQSDVGLGIEKQLQYHKQKFPRVVDSAFLNLFVLIQQYFDGPYITLSIGFKDKTKFFKNVHLTDVMGLIIVKSGKDTSVLYIRRLH